MTALGQGYHELQIRKPKRDGWLPLIVDYLIIGAAALAVSIHEYGWATFFVLCFYRTYNQ